MNRPPEVSASYNVTHPMVVLGYPVDFETLATPLPYSDPDGDTLRYTLIIQAGTGPTWNGLSVVGTRIVGTPRERGDAWAELGVEDGRGGRISTRFSLFVRENQPPTVARPLADRLVDVGAAVDIDLAQGFEDERPGTLTYDIALTPAPLGLAVNGNRVTGSLSAHGVVFVKVIARDPLGASTDDTFAIAAPVPETRRPTLPATSFIYADELLTLPHTVRFSRQHFAPLWDTTPEDNPTTNAGATLGRVLFYDKRLSITNTMACSSCHEQEHGFAKPERFTAGLQGVLTRRNVLGLTGVRYNFQRLFFWDGRVSSLESLALLPIQDPTELGHSLPELERKLAATDFYPPLFEAAFGTPEITSQRIAKALAQFLRSMIAFDSTYDHAFVPFEVTDPLRPELLTEQERRGLNIFEGQCRRCHAMDAQTLDLPANNGLDAVPTDVGMGNGVFRAASLRNVALTAPYMHDGRFATLRDVINHYSSGAVESEHIDFRMRDAQQGPTGSVQRNFTETEKDDLEAFLHILTDDAIATDPKYSDPFQ